MIGLRFWLALGFVAVLAGGAWLLKSKIEEVGVLRQTITDLEGQLVDAQDAVVFQKNLNVLGQQKSANADARARKSQRELEEWQHDYFKLFNESGKRENVVWGHAPVPVDVARRLCLDDGNSDEECSRQMAAAALEAVRPASPP